ncbi:MAG TPA: hypothetical protein VFQ94_01395 [Gallionella sp.]|nr:hypothetical protein [Gallionella sp.]
MRYLFTRSVVAVLALMLSACASNDQVLVADAVTSPLSDLNLIQTKIPPVLLEAQKQPYAVPAEATCTALAAEIGKLDTVLGADIDAPAPNSDPSLVEQGANEAKNAAVGALQGTAGNILPFRGWLRRLSGAERHSRSVASAIVAGTVRRAFLKGIKISKQCA